MDNITALFNQICAQNNTENLKVPSIEDDRKVLETVAWETGMARLMPEDKRPCSTKGSIVVGGSGLRSVGHLTLETLSYLKNADRVFYYNSEPVTDNFIKRIRPDAIDVYAFYEDDVVNRIDSYIQMSEVILHSARQGMNVFVIFYGHPGVFVDPSHRIIAIAKREGIKAKMMPAPSAEDCLFSDLGIDPASPGLQTFEATDMLLRSRPILTYSHVIIWQVGCLGVSKFSRENMSTSKLHVLLDRLKKEYSPDHPVTNYIFACIPTEETVIMTRTIAEWYDPENIKFVSPCSTFYVPPYKSAAVDLEMGHKLEIADISYLVRRIKDLGLIKSKYEKQEFEAIKRLSTFTVPQNYAYSRQCKLTRLVEDLSLSSTLLEKYQKTGYPDMGNAYENAALKWSKQLTWVTFKSKPKEECRRSIAGLFLEPELAEGLCAILLQERSNEKGLEEVRHWLLNQGYHSTLSEICDDYYSSFRNDYLMPWSNIYDCGASVGQIDLFGGLHMSALESFVVHLKIGDKEIQKPSYVGGKIRWVVADGNDTNGELSFQDLPDDPLTLQVSGYIWKKGNNKKPDQTNVSGKSTLGYDTFVKAYLAIAMSKAIIKNIENVHNFYELKRNNGSQRETAAAYKLYEESESEVNKLKNKLQEILAEEVVESAD